MSTRKYGALSSSQDPSKLSLTVKGVLVAVIPVLLFVGQLQGWTITEGDLMEGIEAITALIASATVIWGLIRKFKQ